MAPSNRNNSPFVPSNYYDTRSLLLVAAMHDSIQCRERALHLAKKRHESNSAVIEELLNSDWHAWLKAGKEEGGPGCWLGLWLNWAWVLIMPFNNPIHLLRILVYLPIFLLSIPIAPLCERSKLQKISQKDTILDVIRRMQVTHGLYEEDEGVESIGTVEKKERRWDDPPSPRVQTSALQKFEAYSKKTRRRDDYERWILSIGGFARNKTKPSDLAPTFDLSI